MESTDVVEETLEKHQDLLAVIRRNLARLAPEGYSVVRRVEHGEDLDLDASIEALIDLRAGVAPSDRLEMRRDRARREVTTAFLLDLSASTDQYLRPAANRLVSRRLPTGLPRSEMLRIIDVERQCVALLLSSMEQLGDAYGIYGFSGGGREDVEFVVVKEMQERISEQVIARIAAMEPHHGTRMGAAIRHTTWKLRTAGTPTKFLLLVSDGRPYDDDYGEAYGPEGRVEYAMHDTRAALDEARAAGVHPFLLTVDRNGSDYLRQICGGHGYEVLSDVRMLPGRLLSLYAQLTRR